MFHGKYSTRITVFVYWVILLYCANTTGDTRQREAQGAGLRTVCVYLWIVVGARFAQ